MALAFFFGVIVVTMLALASLALALANLALCALYVGRLMQTDPLVALALLCLSVAWVFYKVADRSGAEPCPSYQLRGRHSGVSADECCICCSASTDYVLRCSHHFHEACIASWARTGVRTCPLCRAGL